MGSTQLMSIRGLKRKQKICELVGNEGVRIGGKRKMRPLNVGADLSQQILSEFFSWCKKKCKAMIMNSMKNLSIS